MARKTITNETIKSIYSDIIAGGSLKEVAEKYGTSISTVRRIKNKEGRYGKIIDELNETVIEADSNDSRDMNESTEVNNEVNEVNEVNEIIEAIEANRICLTQDELVAVLITTLNLAKQSGI